MSSVRGSSKMSLSPVISTSTFPSKAGDNPTVVRVAERPSGWLGGLNEAAFAGGQPAPPTGARQYEIPLILPASHPTAEGLVRIVNLSGESGEVQVVAEQPHPYR